MFIDEIGKIKCKCGNELTLFVKAIDKDKFYTEIFSEENDTLPVEVEKWWIELSIEKRIAVIKHAFHYKFED